ncbi:MAG: ABC transporter permease [Acidobacteriota bacterium]
MIPTLIRIGWLNLKRDRVAQAMTFVLPILFFSIFATVFGNQRNPTRKITVAVVDEDQSDYSRKLVAALQAEGGLTVETAEKGSANAFDRARAEAMVKGGTVPVAIVLPKGLATGPSFLAESGSTRVAVQVLADVSDPIAPQMVQGLLQKVSFTAAPEALATQGIRQFEKYSGPLTPEQRASFDAWLSRPRDANASQPSASAIGLPIEMVNVMQPAAASNSATVSFYAAGIGVMFLLFSCSGNSGTLLEEQEAGTLGRLIGSRAGIGGVLAAKWLFIALLGTAQLCVMFLWGALVFGLPLRAHIPGFLVMTAFTAAAAAGFGLLMATISRSRAQLSGISTILILTMSSLGGSMFPRFLMSESMQRLGLVTFNAWALDGYLKVFWREAPISALWPQVLALATLTVVFLSAARFFARKWEAA